MPDVSPVDAATGEALVGSLLVSGLLEVLHRKGLLRPEEIALLADGALLTLERWRHTVEGGAGAIDHARERLQHLLKRYQPGDQR